VFSLLSAGIFYTVRNTFCFYSEGPQYTGSPIVSFSQWKHSTAPLTVVAVMILNLNGSVVEDAFRGLTEAKKHCTNTNILVMKQKLSTLHLCHYTTTVQNDGITKLHSAFWKQVTENCFINWLSIVEISSVGKDGRKIQRCPEWKRKHFKATTDMIPVKVWMSQTDHENGCCVSMLPVQPGWVWVLLLRSTREASKGKWEDLRLQFPAKGTLRTCEVTGLKSFFWIRYFSLLFMINEQIGHGIYKAQSHAWEFSVVSVKTPGFRKTT